MGAGSSGTASADRLKFASYVASPRSASPPTSMLALRRAASSLLRPSPFSATAKPSGILKLLSPSSARFLATPPEHPPVPQEHRRPFQQKNRRRDDVLLPRMEAAVPQSSELFVQAWLSSWDEPRAGIAKLRSDVWAMPLRTDIVHRVVTWQRACMRQGTSKTKHRSEVRGGGIRENTHDFLFRHDLAIVQRQQQRFAYGKCGRSGDVVWS